MFNKILGLQLIALIFLCGISSTVFAGGETRQHATSAKNRTFTVLSSTGQWGGYGTYSSLNFGFLSPFYTWTYVIAGSPEVVDIQLKGAQGDEATGAPVEFFTVDENNGRITSYMQHPFQKPIQYVRPVLNNISGGTNPYVTITITPGSY